MTAIKGARHVWLDGKQVTNLAEHAAFKGTFQTIQELLARIDDEPVGYKDAKLGKYVHQAFSIPTTKEQLLEKRATFEAWSIQTFGMMSRLSDYAYALITGYYIDREQFVQYDATFPQKIERYYEQLKSERRLLTTAIADPQIDRSKPLTERPEHALLHVVEETTDGIYVSGAKMIATGAPYVDDILVNTPYSKAEEQEKFANFFIVSTQSPGLEIICRKSHAAQDLALYPLASRFDEMDAVVVFNRVFIPNDRIFIRGNAEGVVKAHRHQQLNELAHYQTVIRLLTKLKLVAGVTTAVAESIRVTEFLNVQQKVGELYMQVDTIEALLHTSETNGFVQENGVFTPSAVQLQVARNLGTSYYSRAISILKEIGAGGFTQLPSTLIERFEDEALQKQLETYYVGAASSAKQKTALFRIGWELVGSELGSRHDLYERFYTGDPFRIQSLFFENYDKLQLDDYLDTFLTKIQQREELLL